MSPSSSEGKVVALCGGVGAARFLRGLVRAVPPQDVIAVVNTGDDRAFYGVHVSPDLDIVTYTLAGLVNNAVGYGLADDTFALVDHLAALGHEAWFRLGDRDFAHCLHRTLRLREGQPLSQIADGLRRHLGVETRVLPMADALCPTLVSLNDGRTLHFEDYMIREGAPDTVSSVDLSAAQAAKAAPGVVDALRSARGVVLCPSNPVVSVGPVLAVPEIREALLERRCPSVAISPIVGGAPIKGPATPLLRGVGIEVSALGVASHYARQGWIDAYVLDERDRAEVGAIEALGLAVAATDSIMKTAEIAESLARTALETAGIPR